MRSTARCRSKTSASHSALLLWARMRMLRIQMGMVHECPRGAPVTLKGSDAETTAAPVGPEDVFEIPPNGAESHPMEIR